MSHAACAVAVALGPVSAPAEQAAAGELVRAALLYAGPNGITETSRPRDSTVANSPSSVANRDGGAAMKWITLLIGSIAITGCLDAADAPAVGEVRAEVGGVTTTVDLISPARCTLAQGRLRQCSIPPTTNVPPAFDSAVPLRTIVRRVSSGDCQTSFPLSVSLSSPELPPGTQFRYIQDPIQVVRAPRGDALTELTVADNSPWTPIASFDDSCRISAQVVLNELDVDTLEQAQGIIAQLELDLAHARRDRDSFQHLLLFLGAYEFLRAVADNLHLEVTNDNMQALRTAYLNALPALDSLAASRACAVELGGDFYPLLDLGGSLFALGDPLVWQNPDGTTKTLADLYSEFRGDGIIPQIEALADAADPSLEDVYRDAFEETALVVVELETKLALAGAQLAPWLDP
jgi:hypothetical protein